MVFQAVVAAAQGLPARVQAEAQMLALLPGAVVLVTWAATPQIRGLVLAAAALGSKDQIQAVTSGALAVQDLTLFLSWAQHPMQLMQVAVAVAGLAFRVLVGRAAEETEVLLRVLVQPTLVAVAAEALARSVEQAVPALLLFFTQVRNAVQAAPSHRQVGTPITHSPHLGRLQHEPLCTNRRKQCCPASAGY